MRWQGKHRIYYGPGWWRRWRCRRQGHVAVRWPATLGRGRGITHRARCRRCGEGWAIYQIEIRANTALLVGASEDPGTGGARDRSQPPVPGYTRRPRG